jgi:hypothetical protein
MSALLASTLQYEHLREFRVVLSGKDRASPHYGHGIIFLLSNATVLIYLALVNELVRVCIY